MSKCAFCLDPTFHSPYYDEREECSVYAAEGSLERIEQVFNQVNWDNPTAREIKQLQTAVSQAIPSSNSDPALTLCGKTNLAYWASHLAKHSPRAATAALFCLRSCGYCYLSIHPDSMNRLRNAIQNNVHQMDQVDTWRILKHLSSIGITWEFCERENLSKPLLDAVFRHVTTMDPTELTKTLKALANMGLSWEQCKIEKIDHRILAAISANKNAFNPLGISNLLQSLSMLGITWQECIDRKIEEPISTAIVKNSDRFDPASAISIVQSLAKLGVTWEDCEFAEISSSLLDMIDHHHKSFDPTDFSIILFSLAKMGLSWEECQREQIDSCLIDDIEERCDDFNFQDRVFVLHALAKMDYDCENLFSSLITDFFLSEIRGAFLNTTDAFQLAQIQAFLRGKGFTPIPNWAFSSVKTVIQNQRPERLSRTHLQLFNFLRDDFPSLQAEASPQYFSPVDLLLPEQKVVIQIDGASHWGQQIIKDKFIDRLYQMLGYNVVHVNEEDMRSRRNQELFRNYLLKEFPLPTPPTRKRTLTDL